MKSTAPRTGWHGSVDLRIAMQTHWHQVYATQVIFNIEAESWANSSIWFSLSVSEKSQIAQLTSVDGWNPATLMFEPPTSLDLRVQQ